MNESPLIDEHRAAIKEVIRSVNLSMKIKVEKSGTKRDASYPYS